MERFSGQAVLLMVPTVSLAEQFEKITIILIHKPINNPGSLFISYAPVVTITKKFPGTVFMFFSQYFDCIRNNDYIIQMTAHFTAIFSLMKHSYPTRKLLTTPYITHSLHRSLHQVQ